MHQQNSQHRYKVRADKKTQQALEIIQSLRMKKEKKSKLEQQQNGLGVGVMMSNNNAMMSNNNTNVQPIECINRVSPQKKKQSTLLVTPFDQLHPSSNQPHQQSQTVNTNSLQTRLQSLQSQLQVQKNINKSYVRDNESLKIQLQGYKSDCVGMMRSLDQEKEKVRGLRDEVMRLERLRGEERVRYGEVVERNSQAMIRLEQQNTCLGELLSAQQRESSAKLNSLHEQLQRSKSHKQQLEKNLFTQQQRAQLSLTLQSTYKQQIQQIRSQIEKYRQKLLSKDEQLYILRTSQQSISSKQLQTHEMQVIEINQLRRMLQQQTIKGSQLLKELTLVKHNLSVAQRAMCGMEVRLKGEIDRLQQQICQLERCLEGEHGEVVKVGMENQGLKLKLRESQDMFFRQKRDLSLAQQRCIDLEGKLKKVTQEIIIKNKQLQQTQQQLSSNINHQVQQTQQKLTQSQQQLLQATQSYQHLKKTHQQLTQAHEKQIKVNLSLTQKMEQLKRRYEKVEQQREQELQAFEITIKNVEEGMNEEREQYEEEMETMRGVIKELRGQLQQVRGSVQLEKRKLGLQQQQVKSHQHKQSTEQQQQSLQSATAIAKLQQQLQQQRKKYAQSSSNLYQEIQSLNNEIRATNEQSELLSSSNSKLLSQNKQLNAIITRHQGELARLKIRRNQLQQKLAQENHQKIFAIKELQKVSAELSSKMTVEDQTDKNNFTIQQVKEKDDKIAELKEKIQELERILIQMDDMNAELKKELGELRDRCKELEQEKGEKDNQLRKINAELNKAQKQLQQLKSNPSLAPQQSTPDTNSRHIKTIQHLTLQLQTAYSEINSLKQSLMKKSHSNKIDDSSLFNDSSMLDQSYVSQCQKEKGNSKDCYEVTGLKQGVNIFKQPPKSSVVVQRGNTMMGGGKVLQNVSREFARGNNNNINTKTKQQSSKQGQKRNGSIKKIADYFGF